MGGGHPNPMARFGTTGRVVTTYLVLAGLQRGASLLILPFISHAMSPAQYGAASTLTASALLLVAVLAAPLQQLVFRATARGGKDADALIRAAGTYCYFSLPVAFAVISAGVALFVPELIGLSGAILGIELLAVGLQPAASSFALPITRARQDLRKFALLALTSVVVTAASKLILVVVWQLGVLGWAVSDLISAAFGYSGNGIGTASAHAGEGQACAGGTEFHRPVDPTSGIFLGDFIAKQTGDGRCLIHGRGRAAVVRLEPGIGSRPDPQ